MTDDLDDAELERAASDPATPRETLADLAYDHPALRPAIAANPSTYEGLLDWLRELNDSEVDLALANRPSASIDDGGDPDAQAADEGVPATSPVAPKPVTWSRLRIALVSAIAVAVVVGLVLGGVYAHSAFIQPHGSAPVGAAASLSATDYRFGATKTWQTKANVTPNAPLLDYPPRVQSYPGLWLVSWSEGQGGALTNANLLGVDPTTGAVKWSTSPGLYTCASALVNGGLACTDWDSGKDSLSILDPSTGKETGSPLNGTSGSWVESFQGDLVLSDEQASGEDGAVDTIERVKADGTVVWKKSGSCSGVTDLYGLEFQTFDQLDADARELSKVSRDGAFLEGACLTGDIDLNSGEIDSSASIGSDGCLQSAPFSDGGQPFVYGDACETKYPFIVPRGDSTLTAMTPQAYGKADADMTLWSANLSDAEFSSDDSAELGFAHLGDYALAASAGHLYGLNTSAGPVWEQAGAFAGDADVALLPIDESKPNTPVLALDGDRDTITRLDPGFGATRVSVEPAKFPACPQGQTPVSFTTWSRGKGATLVCQGFSSTVTVFLIVDGTTYTSTDGSITPSGYYADFGGGVSVDVGLGGWAAWVRNGSTTTLHVASSGWQSGAARTSAYPTLGYDVQACPVGTYPLSLSTWNGGWLLTCGKTATTITRFIYVDGSTHGAGNAMTAKGGESCGTTSTDREVCVSANPAVVGFSSKGGPLTQHSVDANYVVGNGFSGAGKGTGAYGLADPKADASSEVAYLNGILQQSQAARSSVKVVVQNILRCASVQADVQSAQAVVDDRTTELQALNSAPVDAVPGGAALVSQLEAALQDSLTADQAYVTAASQVAGGQCAAGTATYNAQSSLLTQGTNEKTAFTNAWNSQIAPEYGTPTYTENDI